MKKYAPLFVISAATLWGIDGIVLRPSLYTLPVSLVVLIESALAALFLLPFAGKYFKELKILQTKDWLSFLGVGFFGGAIGTMAITKALFFVGFVNLSIVIFIQKLQPVFAISLAALFLKERLSKDFFIWAGLAIFGAYMMTFGLNFPNASPEHANWQAAFFALIAAVSFAASTVLSKRALKNVSYQLGTNLRFILTFLVMSVFVFTMGDYQAVNIISNTQIGIFILIALSSGVLSIFLYYYGLKRITASRASIYELAFPLASVILEYFVHGKFLGFIQWIGVAILIFSIFRVTKTAVSYKK